MTTLLTPARHSHPFTSGVGSAVATSQSWCAAGSGRERGGGGLDGGDVGVGGPAGGRGGGRGGGGGGAEDPAREPRPLARRAKPGLQRPGLDGRQAEPLERWGELAEPGVQR